MPELVARDLVVDRNDAVRALDGIDITIHAGELVVVMGGTGAGKSTLALALAGLLDPTMGGVTGAGSGAVRLVLQRPESTFLTDRVIDEVALAPITRGEPVEVAHRHARAQLHDLGLDPAIAERDPLTLSGGEQRRVAIAAVLASDPRVLVLDEPGAGLDRTARADLHGAIRRLHVAGRSIIVVSHDPDEAAQLATRLVVLRSGRIAWDGPAAPVLGDPQLATGLGIATSPEVALLHELAAARGRTVELRHATAEEAVDLLAGVVAMPSAMPAMPAIGAGPHRDPRVDERVAVRTPLEPLVDARVRVVAASIACVAALAAASLLAGAIVLAACTLVVLLGRVGRARLLLAVRPLVALAVLLVALQLLVGGASDVDVRRGVPTDSAVAPAILRSMQAAAIVLATLALSARTSTLDLATALRRLASPLRAIGVPVAALAFVVATALGLVPAMSDELERLRLAQRARGLRPSTSGSPLTRLKQDVPLVAPLFVAAFRRAHLLADALAVRGIDPRHAPSDWRARLIPQVDAILLVVGIVLLVVARFA